MLFLDIICHRLRHTTIRLSLFLLPLSLAFQSHGVDADTIHVRSRTVRVCYPVSYRHAHTHHPSRLVFTTASSTSTTLLKSSSTKDRLAATQTLCSTARFRSATWGVTLASLLLQSFGVTLMSQKIPEMRRRRSQRDPSDARYSILHHGSLFISLFFFLSLFLSLLLFLSSPFSCMHAENTDQELDAAADAHV